MTEMVKKKKIKPRKIRNKTAIAAHFRNSAGPIKTKKKKKLYKVIKEEIEDDIIL